MMKTMVMLALAALLSSQAFAARQAGEIQGFIPFNHDGREIFIFSVQNNVSGGCNTTARFAIDETSPSFRTTVSSLLAAFHGQTEIQVDYKDTCTAWGNSADINFICVGGINC